MTNSGPSKIAIAAALLFAVIAMNVLLFQDLGPEGRTSLPRPTPTSLVETTPSPAAELSAQLHEQATFLYRYARWGLSNTAPNLEGLRRSLLEYCSGRVNHLVRKDERYNEQFHESLAAATLVACDWLASPVTLAAWANLLPVIVSPLEEALIEDERRFPPAPIVWLTPRPRPRSAPPGVHVSSTRTGVPAVDRFLDLVQRRAWTEIAKEAIFADRPCTYSTLSYSTPYCGFREAEGTTHNVITVGSCEPGTMNSRSNFEAYVSTSLSSRYLYAVVEPREPSSGSARFIAVFRPSAEDRSDIVVSLDAGGHVMAVSGCGELEDLPALGRIILPPPRR